MGMGRHAAATAGGETLRSELAAEQRVLFKGSAGKLKNAWIPAYDRSAKKHAKVVDSMLLHFDEDMHRIRVCNCLTEDGQPRKVGMQDKAGGRVYATYVHADGTVEELVSEPGKLLIIWVPSGGFYAMSVGQRASTPIAPPKAVTPLCPPRQMLQCRQSSLCARVQGPGSGAAHEDGGLQWQHAVYPCESASIVPILDHYVPVEQQPAQMAAAKAELVRRGKARVRSGATWSLASLPNLRQVVDFETKEFDNMDGMGKTVAFYWKCVREGKIEHVERTFEEMHAEGSRIAGKPSLSPSHALPRPSLSPLSARSPRLHEPSLASAHSAHARAFGPRLHRHDRWYARPSHAIPLPLPRPPTPLPLPSLRPLATPA